MEEKGILLQALTPIKELGWKSPVGICASRLDPRERDLSKLNFRGCIILIVTDVIVVTNGLILIVIDVIVVTDGPNPYRN